MNSKYRILPLLICLMLALCISLGIAEEMEIQPDYTAQSFEENTQKTVAPMPEDLDSSVEEPIIEAEIESSASTAGADEETASLAPETATSAADIQIDELSGIASGSNYSRGYAKLINPATGYAGASPSADAVIYLEGGVFYVSDRRTSSSGDRLRVHFADSGKTRSVWMDERRLLPMSAAEVLDFVSSRLDDGSVRLYGGNPMLPLDTPSYSSVVTYSKPTRSDEQEAPAMFVGQTRISLKVGETLPIGVSFSDGKGHTVHFISEDDSIAHVSDDGRVTGVSAGITRVHLKSEFSNFAAIEICIQE